METDVLSKLNSIALKIAVKNSILDQTKMQVIAVSEDIFYPLVSKFFEYNLSDIDIEFEDLKEVLNRAFPYFYDKGIEAAVNQHFELDAELEYDQDDLIELCEPDFPASITLYINNIALLEISNALYKYIIDNKAEFDEQGYIVNDICERILLIASKLGVELTTLISLKRNDFGLTVKIDNSLKTDCLSESSDMSEIHCPFCNHLVYAAPKEKEFRNLARINNCPHVSIQYFQNIDKHFSMGDNTKEILSTAASDFLTSKGDGFMKSLNNFLVKPEYSVDDFLFDLYVNKKISEEDELEFLNLFAELSPNYDLRVSVCIINEKVVVNYFMKEK